MGKHFFLSVILQISNVNKGCVNSLVMRCNRRALIDGHPTKALLSMVQLATYLPTNDLSSVGSAHEQNQSNVPTNLTYELTYTIIDT